MDVLKLETVNAEHMFIVAEDNWNNLQNQVHVVIFLIKKEFGGANIATITGINLLVANMEIGALPLEDH
jgi:hypothetical protein